MAGQQHHGKHGPFVHGLNKGGLEEIRKTSSLISTQGREGRGVAVRALFGSFEYQRKNKRWDDPQRIYIEFYTDQPPYKGDPIIAQWHLPEGAFLKIYISGVFNGAGDIVP